MSANKLTTPKAMMKARPVCLSKLFSVVVVMLEAIDGIVTPDKPKIRASPREALARNALGRGGDFVRNERISVMRREGVSHGDAKTQRKRCVERFRASFRNKDWRAVERR